ncbi:MAG TPA: N-acetylmuramoyl-L-alanine amidase [Candidatus Sulfotelmatobacter sp.]|nr:N-acetylmuramoyl-L-alanine amidase [Candidatus Sulfotelmatobacter sp.]
MATTTTKPDVDDTGLSTGLKGSSWPRPREGAERGHEPSQRDALQALLAFSALHEQLRRRRALASQRKTFDSPGVVTNVVTTEFEPSEQFVLDEVLQLVADRAVAITGADGLAIALAENNEIVLRAAAGTVRPDVGARIDRDSAFSGACFRTAQVVHCDDTETDERVNLAACRKLGARSMVAVPLCGRRRVIGVLEAFSSYPFGFNDSDVRNLTLLAELILAACKPEDEDRFAESAQVAAKKLEPIVAAPVVAPLIAPAAITVKAVVPKANVPKKEDSSAKDPATKPLPAEPPASIQQTAEIKPVQTAAKTKETAPEAKVSNPELSAAKLSGIQLGAAKLPQAELVKPELEEATVSELSRSEASPSESAIAEPQLKFATLDGQPESETSPKRWGVIVALVGIVLAGFAAGVWWKLKHSPSDVTKPTAAAVAPTPQSNAPQPGATQPATASAPTAAEAQPGNSNATDDNESDSSPTAAQEPGKLARISGVRHWSSPDSSTVVLDLEDQVQYEAHRLTGPDRIYFDLHDTQLAPELVGKAIDIGDAFINRIRVAQPVAGMTRIVLETKANTNFSVSLEPNPYRLVVTVHKTGTNPNGAINLFPNAETEKNKLAIVVPPPTKEDLQLRARVPKMRIVVDAGHGGWDLGTVGRRGLLEKDLVLEIAQRLGKLLESRLGAEVIYTRQEDTYVPLDERAEIANQSQADLFVSVHANYSDLPSARGVETYYTNFFSAPGSKEAGSKDADAHAVAAGTKNALVPTLSPADLHERIEQSRRLAASVQRSLYGTLSVENPGLRDRGIKEAAFVVLTESAMPGILAEVSFVSSPTDEQKLRSDGYREQIAEALYKGIARYAANSKNVKLAAK